MKIISRCASHSLKIAKALAKNLQKGDILCLFGQLGSGKTVFAKGLALGLGIEKKDIVSPSFVLVREHQGRLPLYHFDLYRLKNPADILGLGYQEYLYDDGVCVIEWAERLRYLIPKEFLGIELVIKGALKRELRFTSFGAHYKELLQRFYENISR